MTEEALKKTEKVDISILLDRSREWKTNDAEIQKVQYGENLELVFAEAQSKLINESRDTGRKLAIILCGLMLGGVSGVSLAYGNVLLGMIGSILAVSIIEVGVLL